MEKKLDNGKLKKEVENVGEGEWYKKMDSG